MGAIGSATEGSLSAGEVGDASIGSLLGPDGLGLTGTTGRSTTTVQQDSTTRMLENLRLQSLTEAINAMGGWQGLIGNMFKSGQDYFNGIMAPSTSSQYGLMGLARSGGREEALAKGAAQVGQQNFLAQLQSLTSLINQSPYFTQPTQKQSSVGNTGVLTSFLGGGGASGDMSGMSALGAI